MWLFLAGTEGGAEAVGGLSSLLGMILPMVLLFGVMYFFMIRPESKRKKETAKMRNDLIVGDEITTVGGIIGKVVNIKDDTITVETGADRVRIKMMRWSVSSKGTQISE